MGAISFDIFFSSTLPHRSLTLINSPTPETSKTSSILKRIRVTGLSEAISPMPPSWTASLRRLKRSSTSPRRPMSIGQSLVQTRSSGPTFMGRMFCWRLHGDISISGLFIFPPTRCMKPAGGFFQGRGSAFSDEPLFREQSRFGPVGFFLSQNVWSSGDHHPLLKQLRPLSIP